MKHNLNAIQNKLKTDHCPPTHQRDLKAKPLAKLDPELQRPIWCPTIPEGNLFTLFGPEVLMVPMKCDSMETPDLGILGDGGINTKDLRYLSLLGRSDIGIPCGQSNRGLVAVIFEEQVQAEWFLNANPKLRTTLLTGIGEQIILWVYLTSTPDAATIKLPGCTIVLHCIVTVFKRIPNGVVSQNCYYTTHQPITIDYTELQFCPEDDLALANWTRQQRWGPPRTGGCFNIAYWTETIADCFGLYFDPSLEQFLTIHNEQINLLRRDEAIRQWVAAVAFAAEKRDSTVIELCQVKYQKAAFAHIKTNRIRFAPSLESLVQEYLRNNYVAGKGGQVTTKEVLADVLVYLGSIGRPCNSPGQITRLILPALVNLFGVAKSGSITREGKNQRGFRNLQKRTFSGAVGADGALQNAK